MTPPASAFSPRSSYTLRPGRRRALDFRELAVTNRLVAPGGGGPTGSIGQAHTALHKGVRRPIAPSVQGVRAGGPHLTRSFVSDSDRVRIRRERG